LVTKFIFSGLRRFGNIALHKGYYGITADVISNSPGNISMSIKLEILFKVISRVSK
jgi:hypothetical protein